MVCPEAETCEHDHCHHAEEHAFMNGPSCENGCASAGHGDCPGCEPTQLREFVKAAQ